jgi:hypothetical protein
MLTFEEFRMGLYEYDSLPFYEFCKTAPQYRFSEDALWILYERLAPNPPKDWWRNYLECEKVTPEDHIIAEVPSGYLIEL